MSHDRYRTSRSGEGSDTLYHLHDDIAGIEAKLLPSCGNNLISLAIDHGRLPIIMSPPSLDDIRRQSLGYGIPIMFPFPDRVKDGRYTYRGKSYQLEVRKNISHALHGFLYDKPWNVISHYATEEGAHITSTISSEMIPPQDGYPFNYQVTMTYTLALGVLSLQVTVNNKGNVFLPMGLGFHPYLNAPILPNGKRDDCTIIVPSTHYWEVEKGMPTGRLIEVDEATSLQQPRSLKGFHGARAYSRLFRVDGHSNCYFYDPDARVTVNIDVDEHFRNIQVFSLRDRPFVCLEPLTCSVNAVNLYAQGIDSGLIELGPGEESQGTVRLSTKT